MLLYVFDIDGTLTDSVALHQACYLQSFSELGITEVDTNWSDYKHHTDSWIFAEVFRRNFGRNPDKGERDEFTSAVSHRFDKAVDEYSLREISGARMFFERLQFDPKSGIALATGSFRRPALRKLEQISLAAPSELLVTACEFETREDIVLNAISAARSYFNVSDFEQIISIGDGYWDLVTARNLGLNFIGIGSGPAAERLRSTGAEQVFPDFLSDGITTAFAER